MADGFAFADHLLPRNATTPERALASLKGRAFDLAFPIDTLWNPWTCPERLLPYLAWALSVDIWYEDWPLDRKRWVCAQSLALHRQKGTLEGIRRYVQLAGGELVRAVVPPAKFYVSAGLTLAERLEFMKRLPEIRIRTRSDRERAGRRLICGPLMGSIRSFLSDAGNRIPAFPLPSRAPLLFGRRASLHDQGTVTPLQIETVATDTGQPVHGAERYLIPGRGRGGYFLGAGHRYARYFTKPVQASRIVSVSFAAASLDGYDRLTSATEGLSPVSIVPETVHELGRGGKSLFSGVIPTGRYLVPSRAALTIYDSIRLHDPRRSIARTGAIAFMGKARLGIAPRTAELAVAVLGRRHRWTFGRYVQGYLVRSDQTKLARVLDAIRTAKSARDTILVDTEVYRPPIFGGDLYFGAFRFGQPVRG
ncbi:phage tail protein I [Phreatobacter stygius]|uniref:Phage tail protein I n=1 Tax=Phreatobacter stygius TaxID=1940610 RepID=A0A4D7B3A9_9HYPH|nr:phage tail protein I [Phreatobacter stygius]QCI65533.1 phage tail protein I [Phreatobacter stygius]